ncbi:MAG: aminoacyl-tRNA hydrolase [Chloroflexi bacterium]|jgi:PTH1 family peptidyl-tRNA hydrolase|nr:aminoacyl-tRNA hydrolase [Chloroflexota bacterium]
MSTWLFVGLGNPGEAYQATRHNIGFRCVAEFARRHGLTFSGKRAEARIAEGVVGGARVVLARPQTFMNLSGQSVHGLAQWYRVATATRLVVVYDDLDLPFGALRLRERGSAGTHNGMRSVVGQLGTTEVPRLRVGIGACPPQWNVADFVLARFSRDEEAAMPDITGRAADALDAVLREGVPQAMNRVNAPPAREG